ncbi:MAG: hypothetical protein P1S60_01600 [Anaerolineae bacterium]|nr:hypothetical protein [Anaerolineae bacterium]
MRKYGFSIVGMRGLYDRQSSWEPAGPPQFSASRRWKAVSLHIRRDINCEMCGHAFVTTFPVTIDSIVDKGVSSLDSARMVVRLERELNRRIRCPKCGCPQNQVRQRLCRRNIRHGVVGLTAIATNILGAVALSVLGYTVAGGWGLAAGFGLSIALLLKVTRWMLGQLLEADF